VTTQTSLGRVLVVEDDHQFSALLEQHLRRAHLDVVCAPTGLAAWNLLKAEPDGYDVVLSDLRLPRVSGMDLLALLRADGNVPFVLMTAFADPVTVGMAEELGASAVISKPFELEALSELLQGVLCRRPPRIEA
jgi:DNA-binding response OmpR family regulator